MRENINIFDLRNIIANLEYIDYTNSLIHHNNL